MSAPARRTIRGEVLTRDHLPRYAEEGDAYIVTREDGGALVVWSVSGWELVPRSIAADEITRARAGWYVALRDDDGDPRPYEIVDDFWHVDGPHGQWATATAATAVGQLVRFLIHATQRASGLPNIQTVSSVINGLNSAAHGYEQLLDQLATYVAEQAKDPTLYDDRDPDGQGGDVAATLAAALQNARADMVDARRTVNRAAHLASRLGNRTTDGGAR